MSSECSQVCLKCTPPVVVSSCGDDGGKQHAAGLSLDTEKIGLQGRAGWKPLGAASAERARLGFKKEPGQQQEQRRGGETRRGQLCPGTRLRVHIMVALTVGNHHALYLGTRPSWQDRERMVKQNKTIVITMAVSQIE